MAYIGSRPTSNKAGRTPLSAMSVATLQEKLSGSNVRSRDVAKIRKELAKRGAL